MDFFTIGTNVGSAVLANQFGNYMKRLTKSLHKASVKSDFVYMPKHSRVEWSMSLRPKKGAQSEERNSKIMDDIALVVAEYVVDVREPGIIRKILTKDYELNESEKQAVEAICHKFLGMEEGQAEARKARLMLIETAFHEMIEGQQRTLDLDGFITFRLQNYGMKLREMVDYAVEEFLLDKQYEDFIELLQYFVYFQEPLTPFIHVMHKRGSEFIILNERLKQIEASSGDVVMRMADQELQMEDVIVSTLISLSPERILLHTRDPEALAITTIRRIFGERVQLCLRCPQCKEFHQGTRQRDLVT
ncbi:putative sporulation protein YtxC [Paenibacillus bouchesdurhonensis]|uniref:putative sporulation protein YtxC n=1 Tax=Paenibacillus bouchesdurhonensis TaxID=1870990 RepID=UPI000DA610D2|nr:putative sporulation protein YtxC [Paenibacillus bouchesdurhonensis]